MDILATIRGANPDRNFNNLPRRILKLTEELGEVSEAYLGVTASLNHKDMSLDDLREEMVDVAIVAVDILLTPFPDEVEADIEAISALFTKKLRKWEQQRLARLAASR